MRPVNHVIMSKLINPPTKFQSKTGFKSMIPPDLPTRITSNTGDHRLRSQQRCASATLPVVLGRPEESRRRHRGSRRHLCSGDQHHRHSHQDRRHLVESDPIDPPKKKNQKKKMRKFAGDNRSGLLSAEIVQRSYLREKWAARIWGFGVCIGVARPLPIPISDGRRGRELYGYG